MALPRPAFALVVLVASVLAAAGPSTAKEGVEATLTTTIPVDAPPGTELTVAWRLVADDEGKRRPFGANGVFVRLVGASAVDVEEGVAPDGAYPTGEFEATVVVPQGGIRDVEIGLQGWTSGPGGTARADALFPITNDPLPGDPPLPAARTTASRPLDDRSPAALFLGAAVAFGLAGTGAAVTLRKRRRRRTA